VPHAANRPLRIRFVHTRFPHWGGRSGYVRLISYLDPSRFRVALHGTSDSHAELPRWLSPFKCFLRRFIQGRMPWYKLSDLNAEIEAFVACVTGRHDIVHFLDGEHAPQFLPSWLPRARRHAVQVIATFHQPPGLLGDLVDPDVLRMLDQVLLVSPSQREFFERYLPPERVHVILHGVDADFFHPADASVREGHLRCITVGNWLRDWQIVHEVAARMPEVRFDIVTGRTTGLEELDNVRIHKGLDDHALAALYRRADILFLPLLEATANNALLEGMASGLPVVATDLSSVRAYLAHGDAILVPPGGAEGFIAALARLRDLPKERIALGIGARARAKELAWPTHIAAYETLYRAMAARPRGGPRTPAPHTPANPRPAPPDCALNAGKYGSSTAGFRADVGVKRCTAVDLFERVVRRPPYQIDHTERAPLVTEQRLV
jgi:glycosyltransferase involved in cell wall biosynthesis